MWNVIDRSYPYRLRGTNQQTNTGLLWRTPTYNTYGVGQAPTRVVDNLPGLRLRSFSLHNRAAASIVVGIGVRIPNRYWIAGQWTNSTTTFTDDTTDATDAGASDFALETGGTNNDGFIIASRVPFNALSLNVGTADTGGAPVRAVRFSDSAGTAWQTADTNLFIHDGSGAAYATGEQLIVFAPPVDWGKSSALATSLGDGYYAMNVRATTAPTNAATATTMEIFRLYFVTEAVADNAVANDPTLGPDGMVMAWDNTSGETYGDALVALFGTANDMNRVTALVRMA